jgi:uncharacterized membrane protein YoaK (UPF0700 family)
MKPMPTPLASTEKEIFAPRHVLGWTLFSLTAGSVNAAAFMACRTFVTHVTGTVTTFGIDAADPGLAAEYGLVFGAFIAGAMLAVLLAETLPARRRHLMALPFMIVFAILMVVALAGQAGSFGPFGAKNTETTGAFVLLILLAGAMGLQNAAVALATGNAIRTTHLTGPATDLAGNVVRAALGRGFGSYRESRWALLRLVKMAAFAIGAGVAARYSEALEYHVFTMPAAFVLLAVGFTFAPARVVAGSAESAPLAPNAATANETARAGARHDDRAEPGAKPDKAA